jgi:hypothetical protein
VPGELVQLQAQRRMRRDQRQDQLSRKAAKAKPAPATRKPKTRLRAGFFLHSIRQLTSALLPKAAIELDSVKDPNADALEVIEFEQPYQLQL